MSQFELIQGLDSRVLNVLNELMISLFSFLQVKLQAVQLINRMALILQDFTSKCR